MSAYRLKVLISSPFLVSIWADADCVLLAPQSASELSKFEEMVHGVIPCALINENDFVDYDFKLLCYLLIKEW